MVKKMMLKKNYVNKFIKKKYVKISPEDNIFNWNRLMVVNGINFQGGIFP